MAPDTCADGVSDPGPGDATPALPKSISLLVDARGRACPLPIIDAAHAVADLAPGTLVELLSDDPASLTDVPAWCRMTGHVLIGMPTHSAGCWRFHFTVTDDRCREGTR